MGMATSEQDHRRSVLVDVLRRNDVHSQGELLNLLAAEGLEVTQATLSRDLRSLGVVKGPEGYGAPEAAMVDRAAKKRLGSLLKTHLLGMQPAGTLLVIRSAPGYAKAIATEIDAMGLPSVMGTIAGSDTVFVATGFPSHVRRLQAELARIGSRADLRP